MNIRNAVQNASRVVLLRPLSVVGYNDYKLSTDFICWDEVNQYCLSSIYHSFGRSISQTTFCCGNAAISAFDLGLLYSVFTSMYASFIEEGGALKTDFSSSPDSVYCSWFGKHCLIHSVANNLIVPVSSAELNSLIVSGKRICLKNFADKREFFVAVTGTSLTLDNSDGTHFSSVSIPEYILRTYSEYFSSRPDMNSINAGWDNDSSLGNLIASSMDSSEVERGLEFYQNTTTVDSVVVRDDLIFQPSKRFQKTEDFLGSLCYTGTDDIVLAVNCRNNMFVHCQWFSGNDNPATAVMMYPNFQEFFDVNEECGLITLFANTVDVVPPSPAEMTIDVFERIREAFLKTELPRVKLHSTFGHIVIPEPYLVRALSHNSWDSLLPILPVGKIGINIVCKSYSGSLVSYKLSEMVNNKDYVWDNEDFFYDITKVVSGIENF